MKTNQTYLFTSSRLGFRNWKEEDIPMMAAINSDARVMEYFPSTQNLEQTTDFVKRMQKEFEEKGFCYFAIDKLENGELIGFTGLHEQTYEADFTPCIDIGWRIKQEEWNKGYATEAAKRCLEFAFGELGLITIKAVAPVINIRSVHVMKKMGMGFIKTFKHPLLEHDERLRECVLYEIKKV